MAERRMFTMKIVDSDAFLDMPLSTQALYFHLNMRADDDGFVNNPRKIQRMIGASDDDLKLLVANRFVLTFENGVIVIKHWRMHNLIRKDRYSPTQYKDQLESLDVNDNGSYTEKPDGNQMATIWQPDGNQMATIWQPDGNQMATQDRIGKDRIGEDRIGEYSNCSEAEPEAESADYQRVVDAYNSICVSFPSVKYITDKRKKAIKARLNKYKYDYSIFDDLFRMAEESDFLKGSNGRNWSADFDWLISDANMAKVLEGKYANNKQTNKQTVSKTAEMLQSSYDMYKQWAEE